MSNNREITHCITNLPEEVYTQAMQDAGLSCEEIAYSLISFSQTCKTLHKFFKKPSIATRVLQGLYQAVIDDNRQMINHMLRAKPGLLVMRCPKNLVIESQLTWQQMLIEDDLLTVAVKRKQVEMIKLLLSFYEQQEQTGYSINAITTALSKWKDYDIRDDRIIMPENYDDLINKLVKVFRKEMFPFGSFSSNTQQALELLLKTLIPGNPMRLDDYIDTEQFLLALYQAYNDNFNTFCNWEQRDAFFIHTIGLTQSVLNPETAKIFCENLVDFIKNRGEITISINAIKHKLRNGFEFYRRSRNSRTGLGHDFACGIYGWPALPGTGTGAGRLDTWKNYCIQKQRLFEKLCSSYVDTRTNCMESQYKGGCFRMNAV